MTRAGGADDLYTESLRPLYTRDWGVGGMGHRAVTQQKRGGRHKLKQTRSIHSCAVRRVTRIGRALVCQPPAAPATSSSPCSTLSCRTFSVLVGFDHAAPQESMGGTSGPLSFIPRQ